MTILYLRGIPIPQLNYTDVTWEPEQRRFVGNGRLRISTHNQEDIRSLFDSTTPFYHDGIYIFALRSQLGNTRVFVQYESFRGLYLMFYPDLNHSRKLIIDGELGIIPFYTNLMVYQDTLKQIPRKPDLYWDHTLLRVVNTTQ